jgi:spore protease
VSLERKVEEGIVVERVKITSRAGERAVGKPMGEYSTLSLPPLWKEDGERMASAVELLAGMLREMLPGKGLVLTVGLGNPAITADALGPKTAQGILATRHLTGLEPDFFRQLRPAAVLAPGVLGQTGMESAELVQAAVEKFSPCAVIAVDALAAGETERLGTTIQLSDSGIAPGAGAMNRRQELSRKTLGVPVLALGIPTVCDALGFAASFFPERELPDESLWKYGPLLVTPKEIDQLTRRGAAILSAAINRALQPHLTAEELAFLTS